MSRLGVLLYEVKLGVDTWLNQDSGDDAWKEGQIRSDTAA